MGAGHTNSISARNHKAAKEAETLLWRALCEDMDDAKEYIAPDCVMMNPLISNEKLGGEGNDAVTKAMDNIQPLKAYKMGHEKTVVEIDMMAVQIMYHGTFTIYDGREIKAAVASTWRQTAGADWVLVAQLLAPTVD